MVEIIKKQYCNSTCEKKHKPELPKFFKEIFKYYENN